MDVVVKMFFPHKEGHQNSESKDFQCLPRDGTSKMNYFEFPKGEYSQS